jgi:stage II sporulation protein GA (sporulation sigma-E factor processing peptidase)
LDLVMGLNFLVDLLLLLGTNRLSGFPPGWKRTLPAAVLGAVYSGACCLKGLYFLGNTLWRLVFLGIMGGLAFGWNAGAWKRCGVFVLLSMALGGIALGFGGGGFWMLLLSAGGVWLLCRIGFGNGIGAKKYVPLMIRHGEKSVQLIALRDTGNTLKDPITGEQELVIGEDAARTLTGLTVGQLHSPLETMAERRIAGLRLIPYRAVGQPGGMLLAMRFSDVKIGNRKTSALIAFAPDRIGAGEGYQALAGGVL